MNSHFKYKSMKQFLLYFAFLIGTTSTFGQSTFQTSYGDSEIDLGNSITATTTNGFCVVSTNRTSTGVDNADIVLYNIDIDGSLLWSAKIGNDKNDFPTDIIQTPDGGYAITGYTYGGLIDSLTTDLFLLKTDDQGFPTFFQTFGGSNNDEGTKVLNSADGGFYIVGSTQSFGSGLQSALIIRTDGNGNQIWSSVNSAVDFTYYNTACFNSQGQILAAGVAHDLITNNYDNYVSLIDTMGNLIWSKKIGSASYENLNQIALLSDGSFVCAGSSSNASEGDLDFNVFKMDSSGTIIWNKNYGTALYDEARSIAVCTNGDFLINGATNILNSTTPLYQTTVARLNSTGDLLWSNTYGDPSSSSEGASVIEGSNNSVISIGYITTISDINGETHFIKTNANGTSGCYQQPLVLQTNVNSFTDSSGADEQSIFMTDFMLNPNWFSFSNQFSLYCFSSSVDQFSSHVSPLVFPNPGTGKFRIEIGNYGEHSIDIFNSIGQKVIHTSFGEDFVNVDMSNYLPGIYYFKVDNSKSGKIILTGK